MGVIYKGQGLSVRHWENSPHLKSEFSEIFRQKGFEKEKVIPFIISQTAGAFLTRRRRD